MTVHRRRGAKPTLKQQQIVRLFAFRARLEFALDFIASLTVVSFYQEAQ